MNVKNFEKYTAISQENIPYLRELAEHVSQSPYRPEAHICPPCGLLNDPNGLCWYEGWYHVFYQWYPFGPSHGMKHWGHVKSRDLSQWEWCDEILIPTASYEKNGCYSGNAFINPKDGNCYLFYTANYKTENGRIPKQAAAVMTPDGVIRRCKNAPVIDGAPEGLSGDIRDPFVFEQDGRYYMLLGGADLKGKGKLILYSSENLLEWSYKGTIRILLEEKEINLGTMAECPGFIHVDNRDVLIVSLIGLEPDGDHYHNQFASVCLVGQLDIPNMQFRAEYMDEIDRGFDFYAPQPFYGENDIPMLFGWFGCGEQMLPEDKYQWRHGLTLPRELHVQNGQLYTTPAASAISAFGSPVTVPAHPQAVLQPAPFSCLQWKFEDDGRVHTLKIGNEDDFWTLTADMSAHVIVWDRGRLKIPVDPDHGTIRRCSFAPCAQMDIRIYLDNSFTEIYVQNGEKVLSGRTYSPISSHPCTGCR